MPRLQVCSLALIAETVARTGARSLVTLLSPGTAIERPLEIAPVMEWMPPPDGIAMCQGGDVCRIPPNGEGIHEKS